MSRFPGEEEITLEQERRANEVLAETDSPLAPREDLYTPDSEQGQAQFNELTDYKKLVGPETKDVSPAPADLADSGVEPPAPSTAKTEPEATFQGVPLAAFLQSPYAKNRMARGRQTTDLDTLMAGLNKAASQAGGAIGEAYGAKKRDFSMEDALLKSALLGEQRAKEDVDFEYQKNKDLSALMAKPGARELDVSSKLAAIASLPPEERERMTPLIMSMKSADDLKLISGNLYKTMSGERSDKVVGLKDRQVVLAEKAKEFDQALDIAKFNLSQAKTEDDRLKAAGGALQEYTTLVNKEAGEMPQALTQLYAAIKEYGIPGDDLGQLIRQLMSKRGRGIDSRWNLTDPKERELYRKIAVIFNNTLKLRSGAAVTEPEAARLEEELGKGAASTVADTLSAIEAYRQRLGQVIRGYEEGFRPLIPDNVWSTTPRLTSTRLPIFKDMFAEETKSQGFSPINDIQAPATTIGSSKPAFTPPPALPTDIGVKEPSKPPVTSTAKPARTVVKRGVKPDGRKVTVYSDGTTEIQ